MTKIIARDAVTAARLGRIRQKETKAEVEVAQALRTRGLAYRKNVKSLPGSPDLANRRHKWAVFVNGCFWHHHTACRRATIPKSNRTFWETKFRENRRRDARAIIALRNMGFKVGLVWECQAKEPLHRLAQVIEPGRVKAG